MGDMKKNGTATHEPATGEALPEDVLRDIRRKLSPEERERLERDAKKLAAEYAKALKELADR